MLADPDIAEWGGADEVFARLAGAWSLARSIDTGASMAGRATFTTRSDGSLAYHERGLLTLSGSQTFEAERRYVFRASPGGFSVFFAETPERLFHRIMLIPERDGLRGEAEHPCRDDSYVSTYEFHHGGRFAITHDVSGPTKSYRSHTTYTR